MKEQLSATVETEKYITKRLILKIGSSSLVKNGDPLNLELISNIAKQCSQLINSGVEVVIVSSGAVAAGRRVLSQSADGLIHDQVAAIYGQSVLMDFWKKAFAEFKINVGQVLISEDDLQKPNTPILEGLKHGVQIVNANDAVNDTEMKAYFLSSDNDRLAGHIANFISADTLLLLTDVEGVLDNDGNVMHELYPGQELSIQGKSSVGTGGMASKVLVGFESAKKGIRTVIANAYSEDVILNVARGEMVGTRIL